MKNISLLLVFAFVAFSCNKSEEKENSKEKESIGFLKQDSIQVNYIGLPKLMDVNPKIQKILFFDPQAMKFVIADFEGNIVSEFTKERDAPDGFGFFPMAAGKFKENGSIQIVSARGLFEYDQEGNLLNSKKIPSDDVLPFSGRLDALQEIQFVEDQILLAGVVARSEFNKTQPEFYDTFLQLIWADTATGNFERFLNLEAESIFQNNMSHEPTTLSPKFEIIEDKLYVINGTDPYLNIYKKDPPYERISRIPLALKDYKLNPGEDPKKADPRAISYDPSFGNILKMAKVQDKLVISYVSGYDEQDTQLQNENRTEEDWNAFNERVSNKYKTHYLILDLEGNQLADLESPDEFDDVFVSRAGDLWFLGKANPEVEEDFFKLYKVSID
ncbi:hypothetical protein JYB64_03500 [Algoriphagus aestuarii]|nr:hypothetical protein [Algoriphagus aestuarii]